MHVADRAVGAVIGKGGEVINQLKTVVGVRIKVSGRNEFVEGTRDRTIPIAQSDALARARPDLVEYHRVEGAKHIRTWNVDPKAYDAALEGFVARVLNGETV